MAPFMNRTFAVSFLALATWRAAAASLTALQRRASHHLRENNAMSEAKIRKTPLHFYMDEDYWQSWQKKCEDAEEYYKTLPDRYFYTKLADHPWRTHSPDDADIVVVPALLGLSSKRRCGSHGENMQELMEYLTKSPRYWKHQGSDHIISGHHYSVAKSMPDFMEEYVRNMTLVVSSHERRYYFENFASGGDSSSLLPAPFVTHFNSSSLDPVDFGERWWKISFVGQSVSHDGMYKKVGYKYHGYRLREVAFRELGTSFNYGFFVCAGTCHDDFPQCDKKWRPNGCRAESDEKRYTTTMRQSKFGFFFRGDTSASSHMYELIQTETIPVIIADGFMQDAAAFPDFVPWLDFALAIPEQQFLDDPVGSVKEALDMSQEELDQRLAALRKAKRCLDWSDPDTQVPTLILLQKAKQSALVPGFRPEDAQYCWNDPEPKD